MDGWMDGWMDGLIDSQNEPKQFKMAKDGSFRGSTLVPFSHVLGMSTV